jgi:hypothetical protein
VPIRQSGVFAAIYRQGLGDTPVEPRNRIQGMTSTSLYSLAGRNDNPIPIQFLAPIDRLKIPAQYCMPRFNISQAKTTDAAPQNLHVCFFYAHYFSTLYIRNFIGNLPMQLCNIALQKRKKKEKKIYFFINNICISNFQVEFDKTETQKCGMQCGMAVIF